MKKLWCAYALKIALALTPRHTGAADCNGHRLKEQCLLELLKEKVVTMTLGLVFVSQLLAQNFAHI